MSAPWILVLGASSGFGAAACRAFAGAGHPILGVHLDRNSTIAGAEQLVADVQAAGQPCHLFNRNAANPGARSEMMEEIKEIVGDGSVGVLLHSIAFGSLLPFVPEEAGEPELSERQMTMTLEVMAHSLVWWSRALVQEGLLGAGGRIFAMTSTGSVRAYPSYGAVGAAKAALESHIRYLAMELAPKGITANSILAGVTDTPALRRIPGNETMLELARTRNPSGRLTTPEDVAQCLLALARPETAWLTGNTLRVDGGEDIAT
jgi:NAD(P)-dependent dehydrogenase (short-subunit alcohol dehydrogenase family)